MQRPSHAIVIDGSIAALLAARVLGDHFDTVSILERDRVPSAPSARPGTPQAAHQHVLPRRGVRIVEGTEVVGLLHHSSDVVGVRVRQRGMAVGDREEAAQLVVDASGRQSARSRTSRLDTSFLTQTC